MATKNLAATAAATYALRAATATVAADNDDHMAVGAWPANNRVNYALLKFAMNWTDVKKITSAVIVLDSYNPGAEHLGVTPVTSCPVRITMLSAAFLDSDASTEGSFAAGAYNTSIPKNTNYSFIGAISGTEGHTNEIDITNMLNGWAPVTVAKSDGHGGGAITNHGLVIERRPTASVPAPEGLIYSDKVVGHKPYIRLTYEPIPNPPDVILTGPTSPITQIEGVEFEGDFVPGRLDDQLTRVQLQLYLEGGADILWSRNRLASASETQAAHFAEPVPALMRSGIAYEWRARVQNQYGEWSAWSARADLVVTTTAPTLSSLFPSGSKSTLNGVYFGAHYQDANSNPMRSYRIQVADGTLTPTDPNWETTPYYWDTGDVQASVEERSPGSDTTSTGRQLAAPTGAVIVDRGGLIHRLYGGMALAPGTYDFRIRATDSLGATSIWYYGTFTLTQAWEPDPGETVQKTGYARRQAKTRILIRGQNYDQQRVWVNAATGGTYKLTLGAAETVAIAFDATAATVKAALEGLAAISTCTVTKVGTYYTIDFDPLDGVTESLIATTVALTPAAATVQAWHTRGPGKLLAVLEDAGNIGVSEFYNSSGELFFSLPVTHPQASVIEPYQVHWAYEEFRGEGWKELNAGIITEFDATEDDVVFHGFDYLGMAVLDVDDRFNTDAAPDNAALLFPSNGGGSKYVNKTIKEIVTDQLNRLIYSPYSQLGFMTLGTVDDMDEHATIFSTFKPRLPFIAGLIDSHRAGRGLRTRVRVRKLIDGSYQIRVDNNPGIDRDNIRMEWGGLVQAFRVVPFGRFGTRVNAIGRAYNSLKVDHVVQPTPVPTGEDADYNQRLYGRLPMPRLWQDITDLNDLKRRAKQYAKQVGKVGKSLGLGLRVDAVNVKDGWDICDNIPMHIDRGVVDVSRMGSGYYTCWGWAKRVFPDGHTDLTLSILPREDDEAADPDLIPSDPINTGSEWSIGWQPPVEGSTTGVFYFDASTGITWVLQEDGTWAQDATTIPPAPPPPHSVTVSSRGVLQPDGTTTVSARAVVDPDITPLVRATVVATTQKESAPGTPLWDNEQMLVRIPVGETEAQLESLLAGEPVYVRAWAEDMYGSVSTEVTDSDTLAVDTTAPATPTGVSAGPGILGIVAGWTANTEDDLDHYEVQIDDASDFTSVVNTITTYATNKTFINLTAGTWWIRVRAVDRTGNASAWSSGHSAAARLTDEVTNSGATVVIDASGITIEDGALTLKDEFGETVMIASGFSGTWADFMAQGLYNGVFRAGTTGTMSNGRTVALPYWTVVRTNASGTATYNRTADTNYPGGYSLRFVPGGTSDTLKITSDAVVVQGGRQYWVEVLLGWAVGGSAKVSVGCVVEFYREDGTALTSTSFAGRQSGTTYFPAAGVTAPGRLVWPDNSVPETLIAPKGAYYAKVAITVGEQVAHSASTLIYLGGVGFGLDPFAETSDRETLLTDNLVLGAHLDVGGQINGQDVINSDVMYKLNNRQAWLPARVEGWMLDNPAASQTDLPLGRWATGNTSLHLSSPIAGRAGRVVGVAWRKTAAMSGGNATLRLSVSGGATTELAAFTSASGNGGVQVLASPVSFTSGQSLKVLITTDASYAPTTIDWAADLLVEYEPLA